LREKGLESVLPVQGEREEKVAEGKREELSSLTRRKRKRLPFVSCRVGKKKEEM